MKNFIAPSILSADFAKLGKEVDDVILAGADIIHFDVMDNHYVPNLTIGPMVCKSLKSYGIKKPIDVHLMTTPVDDLIIQFCDAGASMVSFHPEATQHIDRSIELVKSRDCKAGIALNPASPLSLLDHILDKIDFILIMSVNPGFGGQKFISNSLEKIKKCKEMIDNSGCKGLRVGTAEVSNKHANFIQVDSGGKAQDVIDLMELVKERVLSKQGIILEAETQMIGFS